MNKRHLISLKSHRASLNAGFIFLICLTGTSITGQAQNDRHYNSVQYGLRGIIMNGAMVAGVNDNSAIYYNPAALGNIDGNGLDLSLFAVTMESVRYKDLLGPNIVSRDKSFKVMPGLISFIHSPFKNKSLKVGAGIFTKQSYQNELDGLVSTEGTDSRQVNNFRYDHRSREFWMALSVGYRFKKRVSLGLTQFFSFLNDRYEHDVDFFRTEGPAGNALDFRHQESLFFEQKHFLGMLNKFGLTWDSDRFKLGVTLTTPVYVNLVQKTRLNYSMSRWENDTASGTVIDKRLRGKQRTPFSATIGLEWNKKGYLIAASLQYFHRVKGYDLVHIAESEQAISQGSPFILRDSRKQVFNVNLGWEIPMTPKVSYLGGFRTNFNFNNLPADTGQAALFLSYFDIYHVTTGFKIAVRKSSFTMGLDYAFSFNDKLPEMTDLNGSDKPKMKGADASVRYTNFTFMITYNFLMDKFKKEK